MGVIEKVKFWKKDDLTPPPVPPPYDLGAQHLNSPDPFAKQPQDQGVPGMPNFADPFAQPVESGDAFGHDVFGGRQNYPMSAAPMPGRQPTGPAVQQEQFADAGIHPRDVELILAKLDAIKSELDALHQRVRKIEQSADNQSPQPQRRYW